MNKNVLCIYCNEITYPEVYKTSDEDVRDRICNGCGKSFSVVDMWNALGDIPVNEDGGIEVLYLHFEIGTDREEIWHWFEETFDVQIYNLMFKQGE